MDYAEFERMRQLMEEQSYEMKRFLSSQMNEVLETVHELRGSNARLMNELENVRGELHMMRAGLEDQTQVLERRSAPGVGRAQEHAVGGVKRNQGLETAAKERRLPIETKPAAPARPSIAERLNAGLNTQTVAAPAAEPQTTGLLDRTASSLQGGGNLDPAQARTAAQERSQVPLSERFDYQFERGDGAGVDGPELD